MLATSRTCRIYLDPLDPTPCLGYQTVRLVSSIHEMRYPQNGVGYKGLGMAPSSAKWVLFDDRPRSRCCFQVPNNIEHFGPPSTYRNPFGLEIGVCIYIYIYIHDYHVGMWMWAAFWVIFTKGSILGYLCQGLTIWASGYKLFCKLERVCNLIM